MEALNRINDQVARGNDSDDTRDERETVVSAQPVESEADVPEKATSNEAEEEEKRREDDDDNTDDVSTLYCSQCDEDPPHLALITARKADFAIYNSHIPEAIAADDSAEPQTGTLLDDICSAEGSGKCVATRSTVLLESAVGACVRLGRVQCLAMLIAAGADIKVSFRYDTLLLPDRRISTPSLDYMSCSVLPFFISAPRLTRSLATLSSRAFGQHGAAPAVAARPELAPSK